MEDAGGEGFFEEGFVVSEAFFSGRGFYAGETKNERGKAKRLRHKEIYYR